MLYGPEAWAKLSDAEKEKGLPIQAGDVKWQDVNGDGVIDDYDRVKLGNTIPHWTGGFNINTSWKGLTLNCRLDYALGYWVHDWKTPWIMGNMQGTFNTISLVKDSGRKVIRMENIRCMDGLTFWANVIMTEYRTLIVIVAIIWLFVK